MGKDETTKKLYGSRFGCELGITGKLHDGWSNHKTSYRVILDNSNTKQ